MKYSKNESENIRAYRAGKMAAQDRKRRAKKDAKIEAIEADKKALDELIWGKDEDVID